MTRGSRWALGLWLAGMLACALVIAHTTFNADLSAFLPRSPSPAQRMLVAQLHNGPVSRLILVAIEDAPPAQLAVLSKGLAARLRPASDFTAVENGEDTGFAKDSDFVWRNRYLLSPTLSAAKFTAAGLHEALTRDLARLNSDLGALVERTLAADPTGEALALGESFTGGPRPALRDGVWVSRDGARALMVIETRAAGFDIDGQERAVNQIRAAFRAALTKTAGASGARLLLSGPGVFAVEMRADIEQDVWRFSVLATLLVGGLLLLIYRSPRVLALALLPAASGSVAGVAAVSLGFGAVHGATLGFGVTLLGEAVDYAIYLFTRTAPGSPAEAVLPRLWPTLRLGVITSVCAYSTMLLSSFAGLAQIGLLSIVGLVVGLAVTRAILPALLPRGFAAVAPHAVGPVLLRGTAVAHRLRLPLLLLVVLAALFVFHRRDGLWQTALSSLSPVPAREQQLDRQLRRDIDAPDVRYLALVTAPNQEQALEASESLGRRLDALVAQGVLQAYESPARYLPSQAAQRARQAAIPPPDVLRANLQQALTGLPFRPDLFAPFLEDAAAAKSQPLLDRASLDGTHFARQFAALLSHQEDGWTATLPLRGVSDPQRLAAGLSQGAPAGTLLLDLKGESDGLYQSYLHEALVQSLSGIGVIALLLLASLRSLRRLYEVMAPLAAAVLLTVAVLAAGGERLSIFHLIGLLLVVGIGSNYSLFFERENRGDGNDAGGQRERMVTSLALANLCTIIGFGVLSFARMPVLHGIGMTVAIGAFLSLVFSAILTIHVGQERKTSP